MKTSAKNNGTHFDQLFLDESLDGLDSELKLKAFNLFQNLSLEHESLFIVEHATEFKSMFANQYEARIDGGVSTLDHAQ